MNTVIGQADTTGVEAVPERVLICIGESPSAELVIREAARLAASLRAEFYALHIEARGASTRRSREEAQSLARRLRLAQDLGAHVTVVTEHRVARTILQFATEHRISRIVIGPRRAARGLFAPPDIAALLSRSGVAQLIVVPARAGGVL